MAARHLLNKLAARQWIELPARQRCGGKRRLRVLQNEPPDLFSASEAAPIEQKPGTGQILCGLVSPSI